MSLYTRRQSLEAPNKIVASDAHQSAEQRHAGYLGTRLRRFREGGPQRVEQFALRRWRRPSFSPGNRQAALIKANLEAIAEADE